MWAWESVEEGEYLCKKERGGEKERAKHGRKMEGERGATRGAEGNE